MEITAELVKTLREKTDAGMMDCKKALKETGGDLEAAVAYLRQKGLAVASKRADRSTSEGAIWAAISPDHKSGTLLEVNCETDFVAKTTAFMDLGTKLTEHLAAVALETVEELLTQPCPHDPKLSVTDYLNETIAKTGESIRIRHFTRYQGDLVVAYIHHGGKIGVMMELSGGERRAGGCSRGQGSGYAGGRHLAGGRGPGRNLAGTGRQGKGHLRQPRPKTAASRKRSSRRWWWVAWRNSIRKSAWRSKPS